MTQAFFILVLLAFAWGTVVFAVALPVLKHKVTYEVAIWMGLIFFHVYFVLVLTCFFVVMFSDPGKVPDHYAKVAHATVVFSEWIIIALGSTIALDGEMLRHLFSCRFIFQCCQ